MIQLFALYTLLDFMAKLQSFRASVLRVIGLKFLIPILHLSINNVGHKVIFMFLSLQMRLHVQYVRVRWFPLTVVMKLLLELLYTS